MGGCRCSFRSCPNNSANSPKMHFFHFPTKFPERVQQWAQYSDNMHFVSLPESQLRNKVVCQNHFRDNCFMNYLHDKLTKRAVPTLLTLDTGEVLDFEIESEDKREMQSSTTERSSLLLNKTKNIQLKEVITKDINYLF